MADAPELYRKHRPTKLSDVIGQKEAIDTITDMGKRGVMPHALLFTGPSGCGKTTLARIIRQKLRCSDHDFQEMNASDCRGIDEIRDIRRTLGLSPMAGPCRVFLIDECHGLTSDAQEAFLKLLEDTPSHVYFMLCTTVPTKLKKTIITRCTEIRCKELSESDLKIVVDKAVAAECKQLDPEVRDKIARVAAGSARKALVLLHAVLGIQNKTEQLAAIEAGDAQSQGIDIARMLVGKSSWKEVAEKLKTVEEDPETVRRIILGYAQAVLLSSGSVKAAAIIDEFWRPLYDIGKPGLVFCCWNLMQQQKG